MCFWETRFSLAEILRSQSFVQAALVLTLSGIQACSRTQSGSEREPEQVSEWPSDNKIDVFGEARNGSVAVFGDLPSLERHVRARASGDSAALEDVDRKATLVTGATKCRLVGATFANGHFNEVEVLEGPHRGLRGYVPKSK